MGKHKLQLSIPDTLNLCVFRIIDESIYDPDLPISCPTLQIQTPGFSTAKTIEDVEPNFSYNLSACDLKIQTVQCGYEFNDLPDRIYVIRYSVSPNSEVYVEYNYLRISKALTKIRDLLCQLDLGACYPPAEDKKRLNEITEIQQYLMAAKAKVEVCMDVKRGLQLYNYGVEKFDKLNCFNCK